MIHAIPNSDRSSCTPPRADYLIVALCFLGAVLLAYKLVLMINQGMFTYMLDDPYIHLAVAEELAAHGHYGVNSIEACAPCSSPLWPFLMVPFAWLRHFELAPLLVNSMAGLATAMLALGRIRRLIPALPGDRTGLLLRVAVTLGFLLATNIIGLVFTGMEHSLQVLLAVLVTEGMLRLAAGEKPGWWFDLAVIAGPWIRYENMALTLVSVGMLFILGRRRQAMVLGLLAAAGLVAFSGYLVSLGLSPVPTSITAKSPFVGEVPIVAALRNLKFSFATGRGTLVALGVSLLTGIAMVWRGGGRWRLAALCLAVAGCLHLFAGAYGWVNRYEIYILAALVWGVGGIAGEMLKSVGCTPSRRLGWAMVPLLPTLGFPYLQGLAMLPLAANNIYEQQYQMHRFAVDFWRQPVAVNDLGYVSFQNPQYVLDLWGLASPKALEARMKNEPPAWIAGLTARYDVKLAMVYASWFPKAPGGWRKIAVMRLSRKLITPADGEVTFVATDPAFVPEIKDALARFRQSLPPGLSIDGIDD